MSNLGQHNSIPTHEQFLAYVKGKMVGKEKESFEMAIESDAFLGEALEGYQNHPDWIGSISENVNAGLKAKYPTANSGGSKFMMISIAALVLVVLTVVWVNIPKEAESTIADVERAEERNTDNDPQESIAPLDVKGEDSREEENYTEIGDKQMYSEDALKTGEINKNEDFVVNADNKDFVQEDDYKEDIVMNLNKKSDPKKDANKSAVSGSARLAVIDVAIGIKEHPMLDSKQKTKIVNGQVVTVDKTKNNANYSQEDVPSYYGGDNALLAEIKGSIKPVVVNLDPKYDRVIGFDFEVGADGKVDAKTLQFKGNPYPQLKKQIEEMIRNFPMFIPGKASGKKGRIRYGIMLKY